MAEVLDLSFELESESVRLLANNLSDLEIPGYEIVGICGSGGTANVYVAIQKSLSRQVALKVMHPYLAMDDDRVSRFTQEGCINANLSHSNIVPIHNIGGSENYQYIAMEYLPWGNLRRHISVKNSLEWIVNVIKQIAYALSYSHEHGFIHQDIKPENILFRDENTAVLSDFGIAKELDCHNELDSTPVQCTPKYMCPDVTRSAPLEPSSDIYSLGTVLYEMITGRPPYDSGSKPYTKKDTVKVVFAHLAEPIPKLPREYRHLQPVINNMMAKKPEDRFYRANDVIEALDACI